MNTHIQIPILFDLDVIRANKIVTSQNKMVSFKIEKEGERERAISGWMMIAYIDGRPLECALCKNGKDGWAEIVGPNANTEIVKGDIKTYLCIPSKDKDLKVSVSITDTEINNE